MVTISWDLNPEPDIDHYVVARSSRGSCSNFSELVRMRAIAAQYRDEKTRPDSRYCYRITAVDADELKGGHSNVVEVMIPAVVSIQ